MERLTEKYNDGYITKNYFAHSKTHNELKEDNYNALCKLGKLEGLEEELGIDLITLFKALKNGFYYKCGKEIIHATPLLDCYEITFDWNDGYPILQHWELVTTESLTLTNTLLGDVFVDDYKKTWALTEEELKKEK